MVVAGAILGSAAAVSAQTADELRRIWNDPSAIDRTREQQERARAAAEQAAAQQRAAQEAGQRQVANLPDEERKAIQRSLNVLGFYQGPADGVLTGPETMRAIGEWQKARGRPQTGRLVPPEVKALHDEAAAKAGIKERVDSDGGIAGRRADAGKYAPEPVLQRLFDGAREDVIVLIDETTTAPGIIRSGTGAPAFKDRRAQICALYGWQTQGELAGMVRAELAARGAETLVPDLARVCGEPRPPSDLILLERRHLFEQPPEKIRSLLGEIRDGKLSILAVVALADLAKYRAAQAEAARRADEEKQKAEAARKAEEERKRLEAQRVADEERRKAEAARIAADNPVARRKASEPRAQAMANALAERLRAHIAGRSDAGEGFDGFRKWYDRRRSEGRKVADLRIAVDDFGTGRFQSRQMEAIAVEVQFDVEDSLGKRTDCLVFAWLEESPIQREPAVLDCNQVTALERWKSDNGFRSQWR